MPRVPSSQAMVFDRPPGPPTAMCRVLSLTCPSTLSFWSVPIPWTTRVVRTVPSGRSMVASSAHCSTTWPIRADGQFLGLGPVEEFLPHPLVLPDGHVEVPDLLALDVRRVPRLQDEAAGVRAGRLGGRRLAPGCGGRGGGGRVLPQHPLGGPGGGRLRADDHVPRAVGVGERDDRALQRDGLGRPARADHDHPRRVVGGEGAADDYDGPGGEESVPHGVPQKVQQVHAVGRDGRARPGHPTPIDRAGRRPRPGGVRAAEYVRAWTGRPASCMIPVELGRSAPPARPVKPGRPDGGRAVMT